MSAAAPPISGPPARRRLGIGRRLFYTHLLVALLVALSLGTYLHWVAEVELRQAIDARIVDNATLAGQALGLAEWDAIYGSSDVQRPEYARLVARLAEITRRNPAIARIVVARIDARGAIAVADSVGTASGYSPGDALAGIAVSTDALTSARALGGTVLNAIAPVVGTQNYVVLLRVPIDDIASKLSILRRNSAVSFVLAVVLALAMSTWLARSARGVLQRFAARFVDIAEGRKSQPMEWRVDDEFSDLAAALEDMGGRLQAAHGERENALLELQTARDRLENMVRERSEELERLNIMLRGEIEQRCQLEAALAEAAATDMMTHLLNRRGMLEALDHAAEQARRQRGSFIVIVCDIDHFKRINDQYGHSAGDQVLIAVARLLRDSLQARDAAGRWGGEEFLLLWDGTNTTEAERRANELRERIASGPLYPGGPQLTLSFGLAEFTGLDTLDRCINRADKALYRAKTEGRNRVCVSV